MSVVPYIKRNVTHSPDSSGWYDPIIQNQAFVDFATNAPGYGQLQSDEVIKQLNEDFYGHNGCKAQEEACYAAGNNATSDKICRDADDYCVRFFPLEYLVTTRN